MLQGVASAMPNQDILYKTLSLQEAKDSSEIENIITTHDDLYKATIDITGVSSQQAKEVQNYVAALDVGYRRVVSTGLITNSTILEIQRTLEGNDAGFRTVAGTQLRNERTGEIVYTPPQDADTIKEQMRLLEQFLNAPEDDGYDPLVSMAIAHHWFESIHPFYDGNGRTGRIINILYLITQQLLDAPILYLSSYIVRNKSKYYELLQRVRTDGAWEEWVLYIIEGVAQTAKATVALVKDIRALLQSIKQEVRAKHAFYSQDLLNHLFRHPYTKIKYLEEDLRISRKTASKYLDTLAEDGLLNKMKLGRDNYYVNHRLFRTLTERSFV